jgi:ABC-2 type transport system ATP-binding protein
MEAAERQARIHELLSHFGLWQRRSEPAGKWSRGMKQKLAVARALLHHPEVVFLDEPTAGLDPVAAAALRDDLAALTEREGVTIFLTTHNLAEAEKLCQQVGVIQAGKLLAVGPLAELLARSGNTRLEIHGEGFNDSNLAALRARPEVKSVKTRNGRLHVQLFKAARAAPLVRLLVERGAEIEQVRKGESSLEEVFLSLVEESP